jgi:hypothetical protein
MHGEFREHMHRETREHVLHVRDLYRNETQSDLYTSLK